MWIPIIVQYCLNQVRSQRVRKYSLRPKNEIIDELTHNALSEEGVMWDKERGAYRESLYDVQYVRPGVHFPQFITFPDITPEGFLHVLISIIKTTRYGAQSNVMDANVKNHIAAIALDQFEPAISSYVLSRDWNKDNVALDSIEQYAIEKLNGCSKVVKTDNDKEKPITKLLRLINDLLNNEDKLKEIYKKLLNDSIAYIVDCKFPSPTKSSRPVNGEDINGYLKQLNLS